MFQTGLHIALQSLASDWLTWLMLRVTALGYHEVEVAIALSGGATILKKEHLLPVDRSRRAALEPPTALRSLREVMVEAEKEHLKAVLKGVGGHRTKAASVLGISRKVLWEKLKDYGIE